MESQSLVKNRFHDTQICILCDAIVFPGVCNLHKHSFFFCIQLILDPLFNILCVRQKNECILAHNLRTLDISVEKYGQIITILLLFFVAHRIAQEPK